MIDKYDIALFQRFLRLARTEGTDTIKVVVGDKADTWVVSLHTSKESKEDPEDR